MAVFTRVKSWVSNEVLTASDLNAEFNNLLNNTIPASIEDYSGDVSTMQTTADPGGSGTESLATTLAGEITRLRYKIKQLMNGTYWYSTPVGSLSTGGISTAALAALSVTRAKMEAVGQQVSSSSGTFQTASTSYVDVTNLTVTITTTGRPVMLKVIQDGTANAGKLTTSSDQFASYCTVKILRDATAVSISQFGDNGTGVTNTNSEYPVSSIGHIDVVGAGTYVYKIQILNGAYTNPLASFTYSKLIAYEL